jgi:dihydrofolate reductase
MKIILFMATSLNGMIAGKDGNEDFLSHANWKSFNKLAEEHGCFIVGRKTYEAVQKWPDYNFDDIDAKLKIVISDDKNLKLDSPFLLAHSPEDAIEKAATMNFESALLTGGSTINNAFITKNLVDEIIINIEPALIGSGIPLFAESKFEKRLSLIETAKVTDDILQVKYQVNKN